MGRVFLSGLCVCLIQSGLRLVKRALDSAATETFVQLCIHKVLLDVFSIACSDIAVVPANAFL